MHVLSLQLCWNLVAVAEADCILCRAQQEAGKNIDHKQLIIWLLQRDARARIFIVYSYIYSYSLAEKEIFLINSKQLMTTTVDIFLGTYG